MSNGLQELQEIGAQKIHERTHISREHVQALLHGSFDDFTKIQFLGFISILERDYEIKLDELKERGLEHFDDKSAIDKEDNTVFVTPKKRKSYKKLYIAIVFLIFIFAVIYTLSVSSSTPATQAIDDTTINDAKSNIVLVEEINTTIEDSNISQEEPFVQEEQMVEKSFKIIPKVKLWMGYIDLQTYKKYQKLFKDEIELDPNKEWLLSLGHGNVSFEINGELKEFNSRKNMRWEEIDYFLSFLQ
jgi:predicted XRE-type DNA-binding protein